MVNVDLLLDLTAEILSRLPPKSVLKFKSVSKTWYALIESPNFIEKHCKSNPNITTILVATSRRFYLKDDSFYRPIGFDFPGFPDRDSLNIKGICSGLVCASLHDYDSDFVICNPTTREFRLLPSPKLSTTDSDLIFFGFSSFSNEYKLVRVIYRVYVTGKVIVKAEVYTMSTDTWIEIDVKVGRLNTLERLRWYGIYITVPVTLNGVFYWETCSIYDTRVLSFNTSLGIYDEISFPVRIVNFKKDCWVLIEFELELSLIVYTGERKFELWILDEHRNSWTWKLRVEDIPIVAGPLENSVGTITVLGFLTSSELLVADLHVENRKVFFLYNLESRETKILPLFGVEDANNVFFYTESLLSVKLRNEVAEPD